MSPQDTARPTELLSRNRLLRRHDRRRRGGFGRAVAIEQLQFWQLFGDALERGLRHDRPAVARDAPMGEIRRFEIRREQAKIEHRRHDERVGHLMARGEIDEFARLERRHDDQRPGAMNHGVHKGDETGHVAHGNGDETTVILGQPHRDAIVDDGMGDAEMREHRAFRTAGRAGCIENRRGLFFPDRLGLSNRRGRRETRRASVRLHAEPRGRVSDLAGRLGSERGRRGRIRGRPPSPRNP